MNYVQIEEYDHPDNIPHESGIICGRFDIKKSYIKGDHREFIKKIFEFASFNYASKISCDTCYRELLSFKYEINDMISSNVNFKEIFGNFINSLLLNQDRPTIQEKKAAESESEGDRLEKFFFGNK